MNKSKLVAKETLLLTSHRCILSCKSTRSGCGDQSSRSGTLRIRPHKGDYSSMQRIPIWVRDDPFGGWRRKADSFRFEDPGLRRKKLFAAGKGSPGHHIRREKIPFLHLWKSFWDTFRPPTTEIPSDRGQGSASHGRIPNSALGNNPECVWVHFDLEEGLGIDTFATRIWDKTSNACNVWIFKVLPPTATAKPDYSPFQELFWKWMESRTHVAPYHPASNGPFGESGTNVQTGSKTPTGRIDGDKARPFSIQNIKSHHMHQLVVHLQSYCLGDSQGLDSTCVTQMPAGRWRRVRLDSNADTTGIQKPDISRRERECMSRILSEVLCG